MNDASYSFDQIESMLRLADKGLREGRDLADVCQGLNLTPEKLATWYDKSCMTSGARESLSSASMMTAVCPIFLSRDGLSPEQVGSGTLLRIGDEIFVLTAAHVTDMQVTGALCIPTVEGISPLTGHFSHNPPPDGRTRYNDVEDMAYYRLDPRLRDHLHASLCPFGVSDLQLSDDLEDGDLFTFVGYPWRRGKRSGDTLKSEIITYTGHTVSEKEYKRLGYNRSVHIAIRMRRRRTYSTLCEAVKTAPDPGGMSGGAVCCWPRNRSERETAQNLKLAGIGHTYCRERDCLVATRVIPLVHAILRNNPHLERYFAFAAPRYL
jgi:hypothetical protein